MPIDYQHIDRTLRNFKYILIKTQQQLEELKQQINQTLNDIRSFNRLNGNQATSKPQDCMPQTDCTSPCSQTCKKCNQKFPTFNSLFDHEKLMHSKCSHCQEIFFQTEFQHEEFLCGAFKLYCDVCFTFVERKQIDRHVKICSFRKCYKCNLNIYLKGFAYHLKVCGKENANRNENEAKVRRVRESSRPGKKQRQDMSMLPCSLWVR